MKKYIFQYETFTKSLISIQDLNCRAKTSYVMPYLFIQNKGSGKVNYKKNVLESSLLSYYSSATEELESPPGLVRPCASMVSLCMGSPFLTSVLTLCLISTQLCVEKTSSFIKLLSYRT